MSQRFQWTFDPPAVWGRGLGLCNMNPWSGVSDQTLWSVAWSKDADPSRDDLAASTDVDYKGVYKNANGARVKVGGVPTSTDASTAPSKNDIDAWETANGATAWLRNSSGSIILYDNSTVQMVDPANEAITDLFIDNWETEPTYGFDQLPGLNYVFIDNVGLDLSQFDQAGGFNSSVYTGAYPTLSPSTSGNAWARASQTKYARIAAYFQQQGIAIGANCWGFQSDQLAQGVTVDNSMYNPNLAWWDTVLRFPTDNTLGEGGSAWKPGEPIFDFYVVEYWVFHTDSGLMRLRSDQSGATFRDYWGERMDAMMIPAEFETSGSPTPRSFVGLTTAKAGNASLSSQAARYGRGSFLLRYNGDASAHVYNDYSDPSAEASHQDGDLGAALGDPYEMSTAGDVLKTHSGRFTGPSLSGGKPVSNFASTSSLLVREFENGYVIVNATNANKTFTGGPYNNITVNTGDARIQIG